MRQAKNEPSGIVAAGCAFAGGGDWFRRKQIAHLSGAVADWIEDLGLSTEDASRITGLPPERLAALIANDPAGVTAGEADRAYEALVMHAREHWGGPYPEKQGAGGPKF